MSFIREHVVKALRKAGRCDGCGQVVEAGQRGVRWAGMTDGDFGTALYHPDCRAAEIALNALHNLNADEWWSLRDIDSDDRPWLVAGYPIVAARMGLTL